MRGILTVCVSAMLLCSCRGDFPVRDESAGETFTAAEVRWCEQELHGEIRMIGLFASTCVYPSRDAGKVCRGNEDCEGRCDAPEDAVEGQSVVGICSARVHVAGCGNVVVDGKATGRICAD
jgi:hypothetical protein